MESYNFLMNHFKSYKPRYGRIYMIMLFYMHDLNVTNEEELSEKLNYIKENIDDKDMKLIYDYMFFFLETNTSLSFFAQLSLFMASKSFVYSMIGNHVINELSRMQYYIQDKDKLKEYDFFKYYYPYDNLSSVNFNNTCQEKLDEMYYEIRSQLLLSKTKESMIEKLKYDNLLFHSISDTFYKNENTGILSYSQLYANIGVVRYDLYNLLVNKSTTNIKEEYYEEFLSKKRILNRKFDFKS